MIKGTPSMRKKLIGRNVKLAKNTNNPISKASLTIPEWMKPKPAPNAAKTKGKRKPLFVASSERKDVIEKSLCKSLKNGDVYPIKYPTMVVANSKTRYHIFIFNHHNIT